jgi:hypothetical protein
MTKAEPKQYDIFLMIAALGNLYHYTAEKLVGV